MKAFPDTPVSDGAPPATHSAAFKRALMAFAAALLVGVSPLAAGAPAQAQTSVNIKVGFRTALSPYGHWRHVARWGEVWVPHVRTGWRPYTVGHWVYTDQWGWYWVSGRPESHWGWIVYHYGRWVFESQIGWVWIPGTHWGPAWVIWRRGTNDFGWAPMPPQPLVTTYWHNPHSWIFVRAHEFTAPEIATVVLPPSRVRIAFRDTVVVNRTIIENNRIAVDPGISAGVVAAVVGRPLHAYRVRPEIIVGTARAPEDAVQIGAHELRHPTRLHAHLALQQTTTRIRPSAHVSKPHALQPNENGRLGAHPPMAALASAPNHTAIAPNHPASMTPHHHAAMTPRHGPATPQSHTAMTPNHQAPTTSHHHAAMTMQHGPATPHHHATAMAPQHSAAAPEHHAATTPHHGPAMPHHASTTPHHGPATPHHHAAAMAPQHGPAAPQHHAALGGTRSGPAPSPQHHPQNHPQHQAMAGPRPSAGPGRTEAHAGGHKHRPAGPAQP